MRLVLLLGLLVALNPCAFGEGPTKAITFDAASVKPSQRIVGPDANNQFAYQPTGIVARNVTLRYLIAEAYGRQLQQVLGPGWMDGDEYDIEAKAGGPVRKDQLSLMLQSLLKERFGLTNHRETRLLRVYELVVDKGGPKIQAVKDGETPALSTGLHFRGDMRHFADLLAVQFTIPIPDDPGRPGRATGPPVPVLDRTNLPGVYDFSVDIRPEGSDIFNLWQRVLKEKLGLRVESRRTDVEVLVVDGARRVPTAN